MFTLTILIDRSGIVSRLIVVSFFLISSHVQLIAADSVILRDRLQTLRSGDAQEWDDFPESVELRELTVTFDCEQADGAHTLEIRQQDVKQAWMVTLNDTELGELTRDENDMIVYFAVPEGTLQATENRLAIECRAKPDQSDDVRVGEIVLHPGTVDEVLSDCEVQISVIDSTTEKLTPSRITILREGQSLQTVSSAPTPDLAVRAGTVFTSTGVATIRLPAANYILVAGRGFEYSLSMVGLELKKGDKVQKNFHLVNRIPTDGWVACDTHIHTLTHSGHGDSSVEERMVTIAAEGIELAIATDHNVQIDHEPFAAEAGVREYFTTVIGNEVTTPTGHFNIWPVPMDAPVPDHTSTSWSETFDRIEAATGASVVILNHARDTHQGVRPFGPDHFNDAVGESLDGWPYRCNGMETVNSGATQTDPLQLFHDWMALLNRGVSVTAVGSSDSHDVARHFVGQGRTYLFCEDSDPGNINVDDAVESFLNGTARVSYGLLCELTVNDTPPGKLVSVDRDSRYLSIRGRILGPGWTQADRFRLFMNGELIHEESVFGDNLDFSYGVKAEFELPIPAPEHDVYLVAIATGPGIELPHWRTAKPYQPDSIKSETIVLGCSEAVWVDCDGDNEKNPARQYAEYLVELDRENIEQLITHLNRYDAAVATHAADLLFKKGVTGETPWTQTQVPHHPESHVKAGFQRYFEAWRETIRAAAN